MIRRAARPALIGPALIGLALLAAPAGAQRMGGFGGPRGMPAPVYSEPADVIAAESAFARMAREKGQWTAFRATAAPGAQFFAPEAVRAEEWLRGKPNPPAGLAWQPHAAWMSCDGAYAVTRGGWTNGAKHGWFATVWQRQKDGGFKWVLDQGGDTAEAQAEPDMIMAKVADCPARRSGMHSEHGRPGARRPAGIQVEPFDKAHPTDFTTHTAPDGTLAWATEWTEAGGGKRVRQFIVMLKIDGELHEVARLSDAPGG